MDETAGVGGYSYSFAASETATCDEVADLEQSATNVFSGSLADGSWYFHICTVDRAGNWGDTASAGPYPIDTAPPVVTLVGTVQDTDDGRLDDGEATPASITQLNIGFSEPMFDPPGSIDADDVTNPDNYLLVAAGANGSLETIDCLTGLHPDDNPLPILIRGYDAPSTTVRLRIDDSHALRAAAYRLLVCGSSSITDEAGSPLDGDRDGQGGDDHVVDFSVTATNLLGNPNFDDDLTEWIAESPVPGELVHGTDDSDSAPTSGSAKVMGLSGPNGRFVLSQCVGMGGAPAVQIRGEARISSGDIALPTLSTVVDSFAAAGCAGSSLLSVRSSSLAGDTAGGWLSFDELLAVSKNALSARIAFTIENGSQASFEVDLDSLKSISPPAGLVFLDGFESGDLSRWSTSAP